jgi:hypothetical protein
MEPELRSPVVYGPPDISGCSTPVAGPQSLTYTWGPPEYIPGAQVLGYRLQVTLEDGTEVNNFTLFYETLTYTVDGLTAGTTYKATIQAHDAYGEWGLKATYDPATPLPSPA